MTKSRHFLSCDWGTSSFRLLLAERDSGHVTGSLSSSEGAKVIYDRWEEQEETEQFNFFQEFLRRKIDELAETVTPPLSGLPVIVSGMASSTIGLKNLPYSSLPQNLRNPDLQHEIFPAGASFPHDLLLVSGVCSAEDVMRGEETQLIGLYRKYDFTEALCILPGTHSKHLEIRGGRLVDLRTFMTGELFQLLRKHSILRGSVPGRKELDRESFYRGIECGKADNLLNALFTIRARELVRSSKDESGYDFLSGLLIGTELKEILPAGNKNVIVAGDRQLQNYYSMALDHLGVAHTTDQNPDQLTLQGHRMLLSLLE